MSVADCIPDLVGLVEAGLSTLHQRPGIGVVAVLARYIAAVALAARIGIGVGVVEFVVDVEASIVDEVHEQSEMKVQCLAVYIGSR